MSTGWLDSTGKRPVPAGVASWCARRRAALSDRFPGEWVVVPAGLPKVRSNDIEYPFRPHNDFVWLSGCQEPAAVLVMSPAPDGHETTLYLTPPSDRSTSEFFTDARNGELWVGPRISLDDAEARFQVHTASRAELFVALKEAEGQRIRVVTGIDEQVDTLVDGLVGSEEHRTADSSLAETLADLRLRKDDFEIASLQAAVDATVRGFEDVVRELPRAPFRSERWVEGTFRRRARAEGNDTAYGVIAAAGSHACTLHWVRNDGPVEDGDLILLDAGVESEDLYAADVTRTLPVSGRFTPVQREVYDVVWRAQQAALAECRPGNAFDAPHRAAMRVIAEWLVGKGFIPGSVDDSLDRTLLHRRFTLHGTSHMLGLDVHDCAAARQQYMEGELAEGMVLTVEPGCYFQPDDSTVPPEYRGIGVRIEDDILITDGAPRVLSSALPTQADDVEHWMAGLMARR